MSDGGLETISAVEGCYDTYTRMFKYRQIGPDGLTPSFEVPTPCHLSSPPPIAYAFFGGLINNEVEPHDVQGADDDNVPEKDYGYHASPHQLGATQLQLLSQACNNMEKVRLSKEVRNHNLAQKENAAVSLAALDSLALLA